MHGKYYQLTRSCEILGLFLVQYFIKISPFREKNMLPPCIPNLQTLQYLYAKPPKIAHQTNKIHVYTLICNFSVTKLKYQLYQLAKHVKKS